jgi:hypothetical protein
LGFNRYKIVPKLFSQEICDIVTQYSLLKEKREFYPSPDRFNRGHAGSHVDSCDPLYDILLTRIWNVMNHTTGLNLVPSYSYYRIYRGGMRMDEHFDRPGAEYTATVCFGYHYEDKPDDYRWGISMCDDLCTQDIGDAIVYSGERCFHSRGVLDGTNQSFQVQGLFHFINKDGPHYPEWIFDGRKSLSSEYDERRDERVADRKKLSKVHVGY